MARIAGRSNWVAWPVGVLCAGVVVGLVWLSQPMVPAAVQWVGDALRGPTSQPAADAATPDAAGTVDTSGCRALYNDSLWSELTARIGADPVQDASLPPVSAVSVVAALSPQVRATCTWSGASAGTITTTAADVDAGSAPIAQAALETQGFACSGFGDGIRCTKTDGATIEDIAVRDGVWLSSRLETWHPSRYTERIAPQLWAD